MALFSWGGAALGDVERLIAARGLRGFADGCVSVVLAAHLARLGLRPAQIGAVVTATLLGSAALTLAIGLGGARRDPRRLLLAATGLMFATGLGFAGASSYAALLAIAFAGTLNPGGGDVSVFLPTEQALLASRVAAPRRAALFARYNLGGVLLGALGAGAAGAPEWLAARLGADPGAALRAVFALYAALALALAALYWRLEPQPAHAAQAALPARAALRTSRPVVLRLAALFALDSLGSGFAAQSLLALWLYRRFGFSTASLGAIFLAAGLLGASSQLLAPRIARWLGPVQAMAYTHLPGNALLVLAALMPSAPLAVGCLLARTLFSQLDVPVRQAYVMSLVPPEERSAAASVTNAPRSLVAACSPLAAGWLLEQSDTGWPLVVGGVLKIAYDLLLLWQFHAVRPPAEAPAPR